MKIKVKCLCEKHSNDLFKSNKHIEDINECNKNEKCEICNNLAKFLIIIKVL